MKKIVFSLLVLSAFSQPSFGQKLKGSDTVLPLAQKEAESFIKKNPTASVSVVGGGSGVGIAALIDGSTDIAMSSRKIKFDEKVKLQEAGVAYTELIIAYDALSVVVNPSNKVSKLTREQLEGIFTGKITNWKEVGGDDLKMVVYSRESSSGTFEFFKESVLKNKNYMSSILSMPATGAIIQSVGQTKGAIGYVGLAYTHASVKPIQVSYDGGKTYVAPSVEAAKNGTYPIVRPLYFYYTKKIESKAKPFLNYVLSPEGQSIVNQIGYITLGK